MRCVAYCFQNQKFQSTVFGVPSNIFAYTVTHLTFRPLQIVVCARVYANVYLAVHLLERLKYFKVEGKLKVYSPQHQPRTQIGYPDCFLYRKKQQSGLLAVYFAALSDNFLNSKQKNLTHSYVYLFLIISNKF